MFIPLLVALVSSSATMAAPAKPCAAPDSVQVWLSHGKAITVARCAASSPRRPKAAPQQRDLDDFQQPVAQPGKIFYPLAYGYTTSGWGRSSGGFGSNISAAALMSFPYRYDQFYRGPRKIWW